MSVISYQGYPLHQILLLVSVISYQAYSLYQFLLVVSVKTYQGNLFIRSHNWFLPLFCLLKKSNWSNIIWIHLREYVINFYDIVLGVWQTLNSFPMAYFLTEKSYIITQMLSQKLVCACLFHCSNNVLNFCQETVKQAVCHETWSQRVILLS